MGVASGSGLTLALMRLAGPLAIKWALGVAALATVATALLVTRHPGPTPVMANGAGAATKAATARSSAGAPAAGPEGLAAAAPAARSNVLLLHLVAADSGKPIAGATIEFQVVPPRGSSPAPRTPLKLTSTEQGLCEIPLPAEPAWSWFQAASMDSWTPAWHGTLNGARRCPRNTRCACRVRCPSAGWC